MTQRSDLWPSRQELVQQGRLSPRPCDDQTQDSIQAYYRAAAVGDMAAIRETHDRSLRYFMAPIERVHRGRIYPAGHGAFTVKSGVLQRQPYGQCSLVIPTEAIVQWCKDHPTSPTGLPWISYSRR